MLKWLNSVWGKIKTNKIKCKDIAHNVGITPEYLSEILNGRDVPESTKEKIETAIDEIIASKG